MFVRNNSGSMAQGRISRDPEQRTFSSGKTKTSFSIIYGEDANNKDERGRGKPLYLNVDCWGAVGRDAMLLSKGEYVIVSGRVQQSEYNGKQYTTFVADSIYPELSSIIRLVVKNLPMDAPGNNADGLTDPIPVDQFEPVGDEGGLPF